MTTKKQVRDFRFMVEATVNGNSLERTHRKLQRAAEKFEKETGIKLSITNEAYWPSGFNIREDTVEETKRQYLRIERVPASSRCWWTKTWMYEYRKKKQ